MAPSGANRQEELAKKNETGAPDGCEIPLLEAPVYKKGASPVPRDQVLIGQVLALLLCSPNISTIDLLSKY